MIPDNSNDDIEPSTSGSKLSQYTPSNSPLIINKTIKKNEGNKIISLNKNDTNIIKDEELFKVTPHFLNDNKTSCESLKEDSILKRPIVPKNDNRIKSPLTCEHKCFSNYKFNFNFETKDNGAIIPKKDKNKEEEKKMKKISNVFRIGNKNINKNKILNVNKQNFSNNKIYSKNCSQCKLNQSPINSSLISLKYNINQTSPIRPIKNKKIFNNNKIISDSSHNNIRNNRKYVLIENQKKYRTSRPNSVKDISPRKKNYNKNNKINDLNKDKKNNIIDNKKNYSNSVNKNTTTVLPKLDNKIANIKNQLETECTNLIKILPDNYEEYPEIKNNLGLIFQKIYGIKDYINKNTQYSFRAKKFNDNNNNIK